LLSTKGLKIMGIALSSTTEDTSGALGFCVKSGLAISVLVKGSLASQQVINRRLIDLCDPARPESRQPYHAAMGKLEEDQTKLEQRRKIVKRAAHQSVSDLLRDHRKAGYQIGFAGLVVGSDTDPTTITNPHIRAHALEGRLFRTVLEDALRNYGVASMVVVEREVYARAAAALGQSESDLKRTLSQLGKALGGPWRAAEKTAAVAAWLALG
jgi:hypothetical protein